MIRVSNQWMVNSFLRVLNRNNEELNKTQIQISSGKQIQKPSENPVNNALAMQHKTDIFESGQFTKNIARTTEWLDNTDSALTDTESTLQRVRELAVQGANDTLVQIDRDAIAKEIDQLMQHMVDIANTDIGGEFLFAGDDVKSKPFKIMTGQNPDSMTNIVTYSFGETRKDLNLPNITDIVYNGDGKKMATEIEKGVLLDKNISGSELFFRSQPITPQPTFRNEVSPLNGSLPVQMLNGGRGMQPGIIIVTDSNGIDRKIDLKTARRLDDVIWDINATGSFQAGIEEVPSNTAVNLGIYKNAGTTNELVGLSDPAMDSVNTPLSSLNSGQGVDLGFLSINTRDGLNHRVDLTSATTVQDVIGLINEIDGGAAVEAKYDMVHRRLEITDKTGGRGDFSIESKKNQFFVKDLPAHVAADLGIQTDVGAANTIVSTFDSAIQSVATPFSFFNGGKGVEPGFINITRHDGVSAQIDLQAAGSMQGAIDAINSHPNFADAQLVASFDTVTNRLVINDSSVGASNFAIQEVNGINPIKIREVTTIAKNLGLLQSSQGGTIVGDSIQPPGLTAASLLSTIVPAPEMGFMNIRGPDGQPVKIDLSAATTIQDVLDRINETQKFTANWDTVNNRFVVTDPADVTDSHGLRIEEFSNTARDLGLIEGTSNYTSDTITGAPIFVKPLPTLIGSLDLNPAVEGDTELRTLNANRTFNTGVNLGFIRITDKAGNFKAIDLRGSNTIKDVLDRINDPANGLYIEAKINSSKDGLEIIDKNNGATGRLEVIDVDSSAAADLGILGSTVDLRLVGKDVDPAVSDTTRISALRSGEGGVPMGKIYIQSGEFSGEIDLTGVKTVGELIDKLSGTDERFNIAAWVSEDGKRLNLSNTKDQPYIKVRDLEAGEPASASALGLGGSRSIFETLADLRDNLFRNDGTAISEQSIKLVQEDIERTLKLHAEVGVRTNRTTAAKEKQDNLTLNLNKMLDVVENVDMTEAIIRMTQLQTAFQAALQTGAKILQISLMDFLR